MKRILALEYSQSGDVSAVAHAFLRPFVRPGVELRRERIQPLASYPYPWGSIHRLFSVFPECFLGSHNQVQPLGLAPHERFDLIVLCFQVWHLAPSIPIQDFLRSEQAQVLQNTPVITLCVSRNMWHTASETIKRMLQARGAIHIDNVVVTHQGPPMSTFVSVPRALLYGKRDRLWGIFPPAHLDQKDLDRAERLGTAAAEKLNHLTPPYRPLLTGLGAVSVKLRYIVPEFCGSYIYRIGARLVAYRRPPGSRGRGRAITLFMYFLLGMILVGIPTMIVVSLALSPILRNKINRYAQRLIEPSDAK
jgi:hypothetical protein